MIPVPYSWEELICMQRGYHLQVGSGYGTDRSCQVWPDVCSTCGTLFERRLNDGPVPCEHGRSDIQNCDECAVVGDIDPPARYDGEA